jgi:hypothetical protein
MLGDRRDLSTHGVTCRSQLRRPLDDQSARRVCGVRVFDAEAGFRQLKDPCVVSFSPMFHWTDQNIRVHAFYCVLALTIGHLMRRHATQAGACMSVRELLHTLAGIQETVMIYPSAGGRPKARRMLTDRDPSQQQLFEIFNLTDRAPRA